MVVFPGLGGNGDSQLTRSALRQHLAPLVGPAVLLHRRHRRDGLHHQGPVARPRRSPAVLDRQSPRRRRRPRPPSRSTCVSAPTTSTPSRRSPTRGDLPRVWRSARAARLLLHRLALTYGDWTLMAQDHSQHIDVIGEKELGWLVRASSSPARAASAPGGLHPDTAGSTGVARRHALCAHRPRHPQRPGFSRTCPAGSHRPRSCRRVATSTGRAQATTSAARRPRGTTSTCRSRVCRRARRSSR